MQTMFGPGWISAVVFFIVLGAFQVFAIWSLLKSSSSSLLAVGVLVNFVSILIYLISASGVTIFGVPPQPLIAFGVLIKALETIFVLASLYLMKNLPRA
jgi:bacteriorhodopsin